MDEQRFDAALRALQAGTSRRRAIAGALGALFGGRLLEAAAMGKQPGKDRDESGGKPGTEGPCGNGSGAANRCRRDGDCCTNYCERRRSGTRRCKCKSVGMRCGRPLECCSGVCKMGVCDRKPREDGGGGGGGARCTADSACSGATPRCCNGACVAAGFDPSTTFGSIGVGPSNLMWPMSLALTTDGLMALVAEASNNRVNIWARSSASSTTWTQQALFGELGLGPDKFQGISGLGLSPDGLTSLVSDPTQYHVSVWTRSDGASTTWTNQGKFGAQGSNDDQFGRPGYIAFSADGLTAWITDAVASRVATWTRTSVTDTAWTDDAPIGNGKGTGDDQFDQPTGIAISPDGLTMVVGDQANKRISVWMRDDLTSPWQAKTPFAGSSAGANAINSPGGLRFAPDGLTVWITNVLSNRVVAWTRPDAGSADWTFSTSIGSTNGAGADQFALPTDVTLDATGEMMLVADRDNNRVSIWSSPC